MKTKLIITAIFVALITSMAAQEPDSLKTATFGVCGNGAYCRMKIEQAAKQEGVEKADWSRKTKSLTIVYNPKKIKIDDVQKKIAETGYDNDKYKANDSVYYHLSILSRYRR